MRYFFVQEKDFDRFKAELKAGAAAADNDKGKAVLGILDELEFVAGKTIVAVDGQSCNGMMVVDSLENNPEIEQWVTAVGAKGVGEPMLDWLVGEKGLEKIKIFPTNDKVRDIYKKMGFDKDLGGGYWQFVVPPPPPQ